MTDIAARIRLFQKFNRVFWVIWGALPFMIYLAYSQNADPGAWLEGLSPEQAQCARGILPDPLRMSSEGKFLFWTLFVFQSSIFFVIFALLHRTIRRFSTGRIFVSETLSVLRTIAIVIIAWPILDTSVTDGLMFLLRSRGHIPFQPLIFYIDLGPIAMGVFLLAMKFVIETAIELKDDTELTI